jgi:propionyl-CoA carboxylase alpha chain
VPIEYDGLLAKLVVWGNTRSEAIARMRRALESYDVSGVHTTIPFKRYVLEHPVFQSGHYDTGFVSTIMEDWKRSANRK